MQTLEIIREIERLPLNKKFYVVEEIIKSIKKDEISKQMASATDKLLADYCNDNDLTAFTALDFNSFYEAK